MASVRRMELAPWVFTASGLFLLMVLGWIDRKYLKIRLRLAVYPSMLFIITQLLLILLREASRRG